MKKFLLAVCLFVSITSAVAVFATDHTSRPHVQVVVVDQSLSQFGMLWQKEIERKFPNAIGIICHGGSIQEGEWIVKAPFGEHSVMKATEIVKHYQKLYPNRTLVLLACNPAHLKLGMPGVYYAHSSVWCVPDRFILSHQEMQYMKMNGLFSSEKEGNRSDIDPDTIGNVFELEMD